MELSPDEKVYLKAVYDAELKREEASLRKIRVQTRNSVSADFDPKPVRMKYMSGHRLRLPTIFLLNPNDPMVTKTDMVARAVRDILTEDPDHSEFGAAELASRLGIDEKDVRRCLEYFTDLRLANSGNTSGEDPGWDRVYVSDDSLEAFLKYPGIGESISAALSGLSEEHWNLLSAAADTSGGGPARVTYRRNTAFIMMSMDPANAQLEDVANCFKEVCSWFGIRAERADDVEHSDMITKVILERIEQSEILIADLTGERPNVYYEIGYAHALGKRPILYRAVGTRLHFDLSVYNVPEYRNVTELRELVVGRLEAITGRKPTRQ